MTTIVFRSFRDLPARCRAHPLLPRY